MTAQLVQDALSTEFYAAAATHTDGAVLEVDARISQALTQPLVQSPTFDSLTENYNDAAQLLGSQVAATLSGQTVELASEVNTPKVDNAFDIPTMKA